MCEEHQFLKKYLKVSNFNFSFIFSCKYIFITKLSQMYKIVIDQVFTILYISYFHDIVVKMWWKCDKEKNIFRREITFSSQFGLNVMTTNIYEDSVCDKNVMGKCALVHHHIFMKKWQKCEGPFFVLIFWPTSFENSRHEKSWWSFTMTMKNDPCTCSYSMRGFASSLSGHHESGDSFALWHMLPCTIWMNKTGMYEMFNHIKRI